jgi:hypothetical protein
MRLKADQSALRPASPPHHGKAGEARTEQRQRTRLRYRFGYQFGDHDLTIAGLEIGD